MLGDKYVRPTECPWGCSEPLFLRRMKYYDQLVEGSGKPHKRHPKVSIRDNQESETTETHNTCMGS